jgi:16S rRNA (guanine966-N2)-methyltransferase
MVRVALFNILRDRVSGARVLDLFAGTGAFGIESLSRDAQFALFVEKDKRNCEIIERNLRKLRLMLPAAEKPRAKVIRADAFGILGMKNLARAPFDIIFIDPPYALSEDKKTRQILKRFLQEITDSEIAAEGATIIFRERKGGTLAEEAFGKRIELVRTYGTTKVTLVRKN